MSEQQQLSSSSESHTDHPTPNVDVGEWAQDAESDEEDRLLVLEHTDVPCSEAVIHETPPADDDITVATYNVDNGYSASEPTSHIAYRDSLIAEDGAFDEKSPSSVLHDYRNDSLPESIGIYSFPRSRLHEVADE